MYGERRGHAVGADVARRADAVASIGSVDAAITSDKPDWSPEQDGALTAVADWLRDPGGQQVFALHGFAGSGKTTLAVEIGTWPRQVAFATLTGKARARLVERGAPSECSSTIHRLIYDTKRDPKHGGVSSSPGSSGLNSRTSI